MTKPTDSTFKVYTNERMHKVFKPNCKVQLDNSAAKFNEFVVVGFNEETAKTTMLYNADALTLGQAMIMIANAFSNSLKELDPELQKDIKVALAGGM